MAHSESPKDFPGGYFAAAKLLSNGVDDNTAKRLKTIDRDLGIDMSKTREDEEDHGRPAPSAAASSHRFEGMAQAMMADAVPPYPPSLEVEPMVPKTKSNSESSCKVPTDSNMTDQQGFEDDDKSPIGDTDDSEGEHWASDDKRRRKKK